MGDRVSIGVFVLQNERWASCASSRYTKVCPLAWILLWIAVADSRMPSIYWPWLGRWSETVDLSCYNTSCSCPDHGFVLVHLQEALASPAKGDSRLVRWLGHCTACYDGRILPRELKYRGCVAFRRWPICQHQLVSTPIWSFGLSMEGF